MAEIRTLAIIGAGSLGWSIACDGALAGYQTIVENILLASLRQASSEIRRRLDHFIVAGKISQDEANHAFRRLEYADSVEQAARRADLVIEIVPDELESKLEIFTLLDKVSKPHTILACTTTTLCVGEIASVTYRANKIVGMRFVDLPTETERLEIVRTPETDDDTLAACAEFGRKMGKKVTVAEDSHQVPEPPPLADPRRHR